MAVRVAAVVVAAGRGTRTGLDYPKQYKVMGGSPMVRESLRVFTDHPEVDLVLPVIHRDDTARFAAAAVGLGVAPPVLSGTIDALLPLIGEDRTRSVRLLLARVLGK